MDFARCPKKKDASRWWTSPMGNQYRRHCVQRSDTLQSICLTYGISASALQRANVGLRGSNLQEGPKKLLIPKQPEGQSHDYEDDEENFFQFKRQGSQGTADTEFESSDDTLIDIVDPQGPYDEKLYHASARQDFKGSTTIKATATSDTSLREVKLYHDIQPDDTLQWICVKYGVDATDLRKANGFRGTDLKAAPDRLIIPQGKSSRNTHSKKLTKDEKIEFVLAQAPINKRTRKVDLSRDEAVVYLEMESWNLLQAIRNMTIDFEHRAGIRA